MIDDLEFIQNFRWTLWTEDVLLSVLRQLTSFLDLFLTLDTEIFNGWTGVADRLRPAIQSIMNVANEETPTLAEEAFAAACRCLQLPKASLRVQVPTPISPVQYCEIKLTLDAMIAAGSS